MTIQSGRSASGHVGIPARSLQAAPRHGGRDQTHLVHDHDRVPPADDPDGLEHHLLAGAHVVLKPVRHGGEAVVLVLGPGHVERCRRPPTWSRPGARCWRRAAVRAPGAAGRRRPEWSLPRAAAAGTSRSTPRRGVPYPSQTTRHAPAARARALARRRQSAIAPLTAAGPSRTERAERCRASPVREHPREAERHRPAPPVAPGPGAGGAVDARLGDHALRDGGAEVGGERGDAGREHGDAHDAVARAGAERDDGGAGHPLRPPQGQQAEERAGRQAAAPRHHRRQGDEREHGAALHPGDRHHGEVGPDGEEEAEAPGGGARATTGAIRLALDHVADQEQGQGVRQERGRAGPEHGVLGGEAAERGPEGPGRGREAEDAGAGVVDQPEPVGEVAGVAEGDVGVLGGDRQREPGEDRAPGRAAGAARDRAPAGRRGRASREGRARGSRAAPRLCRRDGEDPRPPCSGGAKGASWSCGGGAA